MKIIFLINSTYPYYTGGRETWLYNVCNRLCDIYDIKIIAEKNYSCNNEFGHFEKIDNRIEIISVKNLKNIKLLCSFIRWYIKLINQWITQIKMKKTLRGILRSGNGEQNIVISMDTVFTGTVGRWAKKAFKNVILVSAVRGPHAEITGTYYPIFRKLFLKNEKINLSVADEIWTNGWDTKKDFEKKGFDSVVVRNGVDISRANNLENTRFDEGIFKQGYNIVAIGTLIDIKGYVELIKAIAIVNNRYGNNVNLIALGKGDPQKYLQLAKNLKIEENVTFLGEVHQTIEYAARFDLVACLSGGSGLSMACLEAMASKTPVIAWDTPVYTQLITHEQNGYLVPEKDIEELAKGIYWMIKNKEKGKLMGQIAYNTAKEYDWQRVVESVIRQIEGIV